MAPSQVSRLRLYLLVFVMFTAKTVTTTVTRAMYPFASYFAEDLGVSGAWLLLRPACVLAAG
jgi:hypothetical protein